MKAGGHASLGMAASESIHVWQLTTPLSKQQEMGCFHNLSTGMVLRPILSGLLVAYWLKQWTMVPALAAEIYFYSGCTQPYLKIE